MRAGTFLCGRGQVTRAGTGLLSPTASNAPGRKDTRPAAWNVVPDRWGPQCQMHLRTPWDVRGC